ncbi:MAG: single-stranded-DNA-specific exonuclease RecJ [Clostridiales bacterium]|nr:single-stranded-DNA-specific exonuclease RecJ [Clostridiales bacterium]
MDDSIWSLAPPRKEAEILAREVGIPLPLARILTNRNILSAGEADRFLFGTLEDLHDPFLLRDMNKAVVRIKEAIRRKEKILVFGDYDADGVLSVVMLLRALRGLGAEVDYFIPERLKEGYGIKEEHIRIILERKAGLVISVDCGVKALSFVNRAKKEGVDVIITDHHRPGEVLPEAVAIINPVLEDSGYPYKNLAGVGVVYKLLQALFQSEGRESWLSHYAKLVAIGTIADVADLRGENRILVKHGLKGLETISNRGLRGLVRICGLGEKKISEGDIGFRIGPRLNAAGRMESADTAVQLFFAETEEESNRLAKRLDDLNAERQREEEKIYKEAMNWIESAGLAKRYKALLLGCEGWHRGTIGIVASKLKDAFCRPVLLFTYDDGKAFGSGRSITEFSFIDCLDECRELFVDYGGHKMAVGCVLVRDKLAPLKARINELAEKRLSEEDVKRKVRVDVKIDFTDINIPFLDHFFRLSPFGVGNPKPVFLTEDAEVLSHPHPLQEKHIKFSVRQDGRSFEALGWEKGSWITSIKKGDRISLVYSLQFSQLLGQENVSLSIEDIKGRDD